MKALALATFRMGQNLIRYGDVFEADPEYLRALARNRLVELADEAPPPEAETAVDPGAETVETEAGPDGFTGHESNLESAGKSQKASKGKK